MKLLRGVAIALLFALLAALVTFMLPVREWRTGRAALAPLALEPGSRFAEAAKRVWIDSDAACGSGAQRDPDDCFAILLLAGSGPRIAGISSVFGNAPLAVTDRTLRQLAHMLPDAPTVHGGAGAPAATDDEGLTPAAGALRAALMRGPLEIVALGPLTNVAAALRERPELQANVTRVIAVMGRRPGHSFHPAEGGGSGHRAALFGHGPVFRDLNFVADPHAAAEVLRMPVPLVLLPYDAARHIELTGALLRRMAGLGGAHAWVAQGAQGWLDYWREEIGRDGFYPFDLMAAAFALRPDLLRCAKLPVHVGTDQTFFGLFRAAPALIVAPQTASVGRSALFCPDVDAGLDGWLAAQLGAPPCRPTSDGSGC